MKKILFRADAKPSLGLGDLVSFINLSEYFEKIGWECHFAVKGYPSALGLIRDYAMEHTLVLNPGSDIQEEIDGLNKYVAANDIRAVFLQINEGRLSDYGRVQGDFLRACICFNYDLPPGYDLVLSWDVNSDAYFSRLNYPKTKFFIGPEYVVLAPAFDKERIANRAYRQPRDSLLVTMGGADEFNFTETVVLKLAQIGCDMRVRIIVGAAYAHGNKLSAALRTTNLDYAIVQNSRSMFDEYLNCDAAIGSGGLTASELVASRTPAFLVSLYAHQVVRCEFFAKMGWAQYLGYKDINKISLDNIENFMPSAQNKFNIRIQEVVNHIDQVCQ